MTDGCRDGCCESNGTRSALVGVSPEGRALRRAAFAAVLDGRREPLAALAAAAGASDAEADDLVARGLAVLDEERRVVAAGGLSLVPARQHRLAVRGRRFWTWCAIDAVGIPAALGEDAVVETTCHHCGVPVRVVHRAGAVAEASHPAARLWNAEHAPGRSMAGGTCGLMNLFCSPEHLRAWLDGHPDARGDAVDLAGAAELGRAWWGPLR